MLVSAHLGSTPQPGVDGAAEILSGALFQLAVSVGHARVSKQRYAGLWCAPEPRTEALTFLAPALHVSICGLACVPGWLFFRAVLAS